MAEEIGNVSLTGDNKVYSNGRSEKDRGGNDVFSTESRVCSKKPICYGHRQEGRKELL